MSHTHDDNCHCQPTAAVQSLDELDFDRGIWTAALYNQLADLKRFIGLHQQNVTDKMGYTPLHYASRNGHYEACELLLKANANVNATTNSGGVTSLMRAAAMGHARIVQLLLKHHADQIIQDNDGNTAIHKAAQNGKSEIVKLLEENCDTAHRERLRQLTNKRDQTYDDLFVLK